MYYVGCVNTFMTGCLCGYKKKSAPLCFFPSISGILQHIRAYERTLDVTYAHSEGIAALLQAAGQR